MVVRLGIRHTKSNGDLVQKQRFFSGLTRSTKIVSGVENQLVGACLEIFLRKYWSIGAAIRIGLHLYKFPVGIAGYFVKYDFHAPCRATSGGVQNMGRQKSCHGGLLIAMYFPLPQCGANIKTVEMPKEPETLFGLI